MVSIIHLLNHAAILRRNYFFQKNQQIFFACIERRIVLN